KEEPEEFFLDEPLPEEEPEPVREKRAWFGSKRRAKEEPEELLLDEPPPDDEASESSSRIFKGKLKTSAAKQAVQMDLEDAPEPTVEPETSASKKRFTSVVKKTDVSAAAQISAPELQTAEKAELPVLDIKKQPEPQSTAESQVSLVRGEDENIDEIITSAVREIDELHKQEKLELERAEEAARLEREQAEEVERIEREQAEEAARLEEEARVRAERTAAARLAAKKAKKPPRQYTKEDYEPSVQQAAQEKFSEARPEPDEAKPGGGFAQRARRLNRRDEEYHARYETPEEDIDAGVQPDLWEDADIVSDKRRTKRAASKRAAGAPASVPPEDPARVRIELKTRREKAFTHAVLTASAGALSAVLLVLSQFAGEAGNSFVMLFISAALIAFSAFVNLDIVKSGILSLRWGRPGADTPVATAAAIALLHTLTLLIPSPSGALPPTQGQKVYAACVIFALAGGALGKFFMARSAEKNFAMIANDEVKNVGKIVDNQIQANRMAEGHSFGDAEVACAGEAANVGRFISNSFGDDPFEGTFKMFAPIALGGCLLGFIITFIATWSFPAALAAFTAFAALSVPFTQGGASGYILNRCTGSLKSRGAMLTGFKAVESFSRLDAVTVDAEELFPEGSITLYGIKTMGVVPIDRIILDATALIVEAGGPLAGVFDKVTLGRRKILPKVDSMNVIYQGGFTGMVSGHRILIGNRRLMTEHGVPVLTPEKERSIKQSNRFTLYFSTDGELDAIFILSYTANGTIRRSISRLLRCGIHMLVHSTDPNIDEEMLAAQFGGTENHFKVMDKRGSDAYLENTSPAETADALAAYKGRITNFFSLICSCFGLRKKLYLAMLIQTALQVIGFSVSLFFVLSGSAGMTAALFILIYQ
ncbi:MAG TPA: hypothetical protein DEQ02_03350, partial [Ruminococcaceae bacterium]|nr:hypothetical protein [Oscillospiraceae bacterium]